MQLELHPDGEIYIREDAGGTLYSEARAVFEADLGQALTLPEGMVSLVYQDSAGRLAYADAKGNAFPEPGLAVYAPGDAAFAALETLLAAKAARDNPPAPVPTLAELQASAVRRIDAAAEATRLRYITGGAGQAATYMVKEQQAEAFKAAGYAGTVPGMVQAEVDATGATAQQAADVILATRDAWVAKAVQIEDARRKGDVAVAVAADVAAVQAALSTALAALGAL